MLKQYVIVPKKPKMSVGKIASQVAHATYLALAKQRETQHHIIKQWRESGMCVIVLECKDTLELMGINEYLNQWWETYWIHHHMYIDEGHTEVSMGTPTCLATGVVQEDKQWIFDTMKLYGDKNGNKR